MESHIARLRGYAQEKVTAARSRIVENIRRRGQSLVLDVALPGAAYFSVAAGGMADVLHYLGEDVVRVDRFIGASGGACSLFLLLANEPQVRSPQEHGHLCPSAELLLRGYLEYADSQGHNSILRAFNGFVQGVVGVTSFWERKYRDILQNASAWDAIRSRAFVAVSADPLKLGKRGQEVLEAPCDNYIFHSFANREQAVQAFVATGEATARGFLVGIRVHQTVELGQAAPEEQSFTVQEVAGGLKSVTLPRSFCDGGHPTSLQSLPMPVGSSAKSLLYYVTWFEEMRDAAFCTPESVATLYKRGVDRTIECLCNDDLYAYGDAGEANTVKKDKMVIIGADEVLKRRLAMVSREGSLQGGAFVNLSEHKVIIA